MISPLPNFIFMTTGNRVYFLWNENRLHVLSKYKEESILDQSKNEEKVNKQNEISFEWPCQKPCAWVSIEDEIRK